MSNDTQSWESEVHRDMGEQLQDDIVIFKILAQHLASLPILGRVLLPELVGGKVLPFTTEAEESQIPPPHCLLFSNPPESYSMAHLQDATTHEFETSLSEMRMKRQCRNHF